MSKKNIVTEDEDFRYLEENFEEMMKEMEKDKETHEYQIPQIWDYDFRKTIDETLEREQCKRSRKRMRNLSIAAGIALVTLVGVDRSLVAVQGDGIKEVVEGVFEFEDKNVVTSGTVEEKNMVEEKEIYEICFDISSLETAYEQIREELKMPMFYVTYIPEEYELTEAKYDRAYRFLNIRLEKGEKKLYFSQQQISDMKATGIARDEKECALVLNEKLNCETPIFQSEQDNTYVFTVEKGTVALYGSVSGSLEECKKIVESITFQ